MSIQRFIEESVSYVALDEFLAKQLDRAGYGGVEKIKTPLGTRLIIYAARPGVVIGRRGSNIQEITRTLEEKFKLTNPQIAVSEVEVPELDPRIMASRIADALQRGIHFRRTGFWALNRIMRAGALGCEIILKGKLTSRRHRCEKYVEGYIPKCGEVAQRNTKSAIKDVKMKQGIIGIRVTIIPPDADFLDKIIARPLIHKGNEDEEKENSSSVQDNKELEE